MSSAVEVIFGLVGGLAVFLYGMMMMSESIQKAAGARMRKILSALTRNPVMGVISGMLVTAVLQSSSAVSVMAIGFVSAGLMTLPQAISIIFGSNIGTTITAQIVAFSLGDYIYVFIAIGFFLSLISKRENIKNIGESIFSFGVLFLGIEIMSTTMKPLADADIFVNAISNVQNNPFLGLLVGTVMTLVVQSSSATIAVLQGFARQAATSASALTLSGALPVLLGDNIGTTVTAGLASITQSRDAKRVALAHFIFNLSGAVIFMIIRVPFASLVESISPSGALEDVIARQIANAHTCFNIIMTCVWLPLLPLMVKIVRRIIPDKPSAAINQPAYHLDERMLSQPEASLQMLREEIEYIRNTFSDVLNKMTVFPEKHAPDNDETLVEILKMLSSREAKTDDFLLKLFAAGSLSEEQAHEAGNIMILCREQGQMITLALHLLDEKARVKKDNVIFSQEAQDEINEAYVRMRRLYGELVKIMEDTGSDDAVNKAHDSAMRQNERCIRHHLRRVQAGTCSSDMTESLYNIVHTISGMDESCSNMVSTLARCAEPWDIDRDEPASPAEVETAGQAA